MTKQRRSYPKEFKIDAVKYWKSSNLNREQAAEKLGITDPSALSRWAREQKLKGQDAFSGNGKLSGKDAEIARLKKQLRDTEIERDILKKAVGIFSRY